MPDKRLKDSLPFIPDPNQPGPPSWLKDELVPGPGAITLDIDGPDEFQTRVAPSRMKASDVGKSQAERFVSFLKMGIKPGEAARRLHSTVQHIMSDTETQKKVKQLVDEYTLDAATRKAAVRALQNKLILGDDPKLALEAAKFAADDPEVGLGKGAAPAVQIDVNLRNVLAEKVEPLPGIAPPLAQLPAAEDVIDVEEVESGNNRDS